MKAHLWSAAELLALNEALHYMKMNELKDVCLSYSLPTNGNKIELIHRIMTYIETGKIVPPKQIPTISKAKKGVRYRLETSALMLYGAYKNDAKTRAFFKVLVGNHFHFTAFGIDWLKNRWMLGDPPTYAEFAAFWQQQYTRRQHEKVPPKKEWAYINFTQQFLLQNPDASKERVIKAWQDTREAYVNKVKKMLKQYRTSNNQQA